MVALKNTLAAIPGGGIRRYYGTAHHDGSQWFANLGGNLITARWNPQTEPTQGMPIVVDLAEDDGGQSAAYVLGAYADQPAAPAIPPPAVSAPVPAGGSPAILGTHRTRATKSNTFWGPGGWGSYATSQRGGEDVYTGSYASGPVMGAWFYGAGNTPLSERTIKEARFRIPQRLNAGSYNSPVMIHLYAHTSRIQPAGDVSRTVGPFDVTVDPAAPPKWAVLPSSFHAALVAGGGISISGDPYAGFMSRLKDPDSGKLEFDWTT
jgi:hypothetical protein